MRKLTAATVVLLAAAGAIEAAGAAEPQGRRLIALADRDGDGVISRAELDALRAFAFERADRNGDGAIDKAEIEDLRAAMDDRASMMRGRAGMLFRRMDADGDGRLTSAELRSRSAFFDRADADGDGKLTATELADLGGGAGLFRHR